jgi:hypothetical protein
MNRALSSTAFALATALAAPAAAQTEAELRQQLEAQKALNEQLRKRVDDLERQLSGAPPVRALRPVERPATATEPETAESVTAIEEALVEKGLLLLPAGAFRFSPGISWVHSGAAVNGSRSDTYVGTLAIQVGLPRGMMLSASAPYVHRDTSIGSNTGVGDFSLGVSKKLNNETERVPALVASLGYSHDNGKDPFQPISIGSGFRYLSATLLALKRIDPVALYGSLSYSHGFSRNVSADNLFGEPRFRGRVAPGAAWSYRLGTSLAATPDISLDASVLGAFVEGATVRSDAMGTAKLARSTIALINLGAGFILTRQLSLFMSWSAGTTQDSPDFIFSTNLAYRF